MIQLYKDYYAKVDDNCYTLVFDKRKTDKEGNKLYDSIGYYGTLKSCINGLRRHLEKKELQKADLSLQEAIKKIQEVGETIKGIFKDKGL